MAVPPPSQILAQLKSIGNGLDQNNLDQLMAGLSQKVEDFIEQNRNHILGYNNEDQNQILKILSGFKKDISEINQSLSLASIDNRSLDTSFTLEAFLGQNRPKSVEAEMSSAMDKIKADPNYTPPIAPVEGNQVITDNMDLRRKFDSCIQIIDGLLTDIHSTQAKRSWRCVIL